MQSHALIILEKAGTLISLEEARFRLGRQAQQDKNPVTSLADAAAMVLVCLVASVHAGP